MRLRAFAAEDVKSEAVSSSELDFLILKKCLLENIMIKVGISDSCLIRVEVVLTKRWFIFRIWTKISTE